MGRQGRKNGILTPNSDSWDQKSQTGRRAKMSYPTLGASSVIVRHSRALGAQLFAYQEGKNITERLNMYLQITEQDMHRCTRHGLNVCIPKVLLLFFKVGRDGEQNLPLEEYKCNKRCKTTKYKHQNVNKVPMGYRVELGRWESPWDEATDSVVSASNRLHFALTQNSKCTNKIER